MKKIIKIIDKMFFNSLLLRVVTKIKLFKSKSSLNKIYNNKIEIILAKNQQSELAKLCDLYGTDKGEISSIGNPYSWQSHTYTDFYELIFFPIRNQVKALLECGIGTNDVEITSNMGGSAKPGASLRVWKNYFYNAKIFGVDIDEKVLFDDDRIKTYCVDQTSNQSIQNFLTALDEKIKFDIIIDDGLHTFEAGKIFFENTVNRLAENGIYIIEDVSPFDITAYGKYFKNHQNQFHVCFIDLDFPNCKIKDNCLIMITKK